MAKVKKKPTNAGGKREGAGQFSPFGEKTQVASYRVPISKLEIFDSAATAMLEQWKIKDGEGIKAKVDKAIESGEIAKIIHIDKESAIKLIEDTLNDMPLLPENGVFIGKLPEPKIIFYDSEDEKGVEAVFPKEEQDPEKDHAELNQEQRYSEAFIESLLDTAKQKYKTGKIIKEVGTNEEYRIAYGLDFDRESDNIVMGGTSIEKGIYNSRVVLFSNDEWAKF